MKTLKIVLFAIILVPLALIALLALWLSTVSPERFIPLVEQQLRAHNIEASFGGEIAWSFYPNIGLEVNDATIRQLGDQSEQPLAEIASARFSVQLLPLLKRQILIDGVSLSGAKIHLQVHAQGNSNWQRIAAAENAPQNPGTDSQTSKAPLPSMQIKRLRVAVDMLAYIDDSAQQQVKLTDMLLFGKNINLRSESFAFSAEFIGKYNQLPALQFALTGRMALSPEADKVSAQGLNLTISASGKASENLLITADVAAGFDDILQAKGMFTIETFNPKAFLGALDIPLAETANPASFSRLSVKTPFTWVDNELALSDSTVIFDESTITGITKIKLSTDPSGLPITRSHWAIDKLNLDHYLPPAPAAASTTESPSRAKLAAEPVALPFEQLKHLDLDSSLTVHTLTYNAENLRNGTVGVSSKSGLTQFKLSFKQAFDSAIELNGKLNTQQKPAQLALAGQSQGLNLGKLIKSFADFEHIVGSSNTQFTARSQGLTDQDLIANLSAQLDLASDELRFAPFNLEQQFCTAMALLESKTLDTSDWEKFTVLSPVQIKADYQNHTLALQNFSGQVHTLAAAASGRFNLNSGDFEFPVSLALSNVDASIQRCSSVNQAWKSQQIPIVCKGNIDNIGINTCLPDLALLKTLAKARIDQRLAREKDKLEAKIAEQRKKAKAKASDKIEQQAGKLVDKETSDKLEDAWKNLIKKNR